MASIDSVRFLIHRSSCRFRFASR